MSAAQELWAGVGCGAFAVALLLWGELRRMTVRRASLALIAAGLTVAVVAAVVYRRYLIDVAILGGTVTAIRHKTGLHRRHPRRKTIVELAGASALGVLVGRKTKAATHPCGQCGHPIGAPSRAVYCSPACRNYARLERAEISRHADTLAGFGEVPY